MIIRVIMLTLAFAFSCQVKKKEKPATPELKSVNEIPFPHPQNFKDIDQHGFMFLSDKGQYCSQCHGDQLQGQDSANSCSSCHTSYPHTWTKNSREHGVQGKKDFAQCQKCHESALNKKAPIDLKAKLPPKCVSCHQYPHQTTWTESNNENFHGKVYVELKENIEQRNKCHACHNSESPTTKAPSCKSCHAQFPHMTDFKSQHGATSKNMDTTQVHQECLQCHNLQTDKTSLNYNEESCYSCHNYPHQKTSWIDKTSSNFHGVAFKKSQSGECQTCHGNELKGKVEGDSKSCFTCHNNYPHNQADWKTNHKQIYLSESKTNLTGETKCMNCHGKSYEGTATAPACKTCHTDVPHTWQKWPTTREHGYRYIKEMNLKKISCTQCHGAKLQGGQIAPACEQCHKFYPHAKSATWTPNDWYFPHFETDFDKRIDKNGCEICHNGNMKEWVRPTGMCDACHSLPNLLNSEKP